MVGRGRTVGLGATVRFFWKKMFTFVRAGPCWGCGLTVLGSLFIGELADAGCSIVGLVGGGVVLTGRMMGPPPLPLVTEKSA